VGKGRFNRNFEYNKDEKADGGKDKGHKEKSKPSASKSPSKGGGRTDSRQGRSKSFGGSAKKGQVGKGNQAKVKGFNASGTKSFKAPGSSWAPKSSSGGRGGRGGGSSRGGGRGGSRGGGGSRGRR